MNDEIHDADKNVTVSFDGGIKLEIKTTLKKAIQAAGFLADDTQAKLASSHTLSTTEVEPARGQKVNSPLEAIRNSNADTFPQQITALAVYMTQRNQSESFDPKEILTLLRRIGNSPKNFGRDLRMATDVYAYLHREAPNQYIVTEYGKEMVTNSFEGTREGASRRRKSGTRKKPVQEAD